MSRTLTKRAGALLPLLAMSLLVLSAGRSRADVIAQDPTVNSNGSNFTWTYDMKLTNDEIVKTGNFFTIYDFSGFVPGTNFQPANWVFSSSSTGATPSRVSPTDNPHIPNLTWTYTGTATIGPGPLDLGLFGADSTQGHAKVGMFATEAIKYAPHKPGNGKPVDNVGFVGVPSAIPEANALLLLLPGLAPLGLLLRKRQA